MPEFEAPAPTTEQQAMLARQSSLKIHTNFGVAVVGCGGVGMWTALFLALAGVECLYLFDPDTVSEHNLNRLPIPRSAIGKSKSQATADLIATLRPSCKTTSLGAFTAELANQIKLHKDVRWSIACTDTHKSRSVLYSWCRKTYVYPNNYYIEAAAEGEFGSIAPNPGEFTTPEESQPGYASVPIWVGPCVTAAAMACAHILHNQPMDTDDAVRIGWDARVTVFSQTQHAEHQAEITNAVAQAKKRTRKPKPPTTTTPEGAINATNQR